MELPSLRVLPLPFKQTKQIDFPRLLTQIIESHYGQDAQQFQEPMKQFQTLRNEATLLFGGEEGKEKIHSVEDAVEDETLNAMYTYFGQLELFELHFPQSILEKENFHFEWSDSFNTQNFQQQSAFPFEKASILYNMAVLVSHLANKKYQKKDYKVGYNYFQAAAGVFKYIGDNFLHSPFEDMGKECVQVLTQLMLSQAQEVFFEKAFEEKKTKMLMKFTFQLKEYNEKLLEQCQQEKLKNYLPSHWTLHFKWKIKYFTALSHYYRSLLSAEESQFGNQVSHLQHACQQLKEAQKAINDYFANSSSFLNFSDILPPFLRNNNQQQQQQQQQKQEFKQKITELQTFLDKQLASATKDNDVIYNEPVPPIGQLLNQLTGLNVAQPAKLTEVLPHLPAKIGSDLFQKLIPMNVLEQESLYTSMKDEFRREVESQLKLADDEMEAKLHSGQVRDILGKIRVYLMQQESKQPLELPSEVLQWADKIRKQEQLEKLGLVLTNGLEQNRQQIYFTLGQIEKALKEDLEADQQIKMKNDQFPLGNHLSFRNDLQKIERDLEAGKKGDFILNEKFQKILPELGLLLGPDEQLKSVFQSIARSNEPKTTSAQQLLDLPNEDQEDHSKQKEIADYQQASQMLLKLEQMKKERQEFLQSFKTRLRNNDIHQLLVLNRQNEKAVMENELGKFKKEFQLLKQENLFQHNLMLQQLIDKIQALQKSKMVSEFDHLGSQKMDFIKKLNDCKLTYDELSLNAKKGGEFYKNLFRNADDLLNRVSEYLKQRQNDRRQFQEQQTQSSAISLQNKLQQMSVGSPVSSTMSPPPFAAYQQPPLNYIPSFADRPPFPVGDMNRPIFPAAEPPKPSLGLPRHLSAGLSLPSHLQQPLNSLSQPQSLNQPPNMPPTQQPNQPPPFPFQQPPFGYPFAPPPGHQPPPMGYPMMPPGFQPPGMPPPPMGPPFGMPPPFYGQPPPHQQPPYQPQQQKTNNSQPTAPSDHSLL